MKVWHIPLLVMILVISSCMKKIEYKLQFENKSPYKINNLTFIMDKKDSVTLEPFQKSEILSTTYTSLWANFMQTGGLAVYVFSYSINDSTFTSNTGNWFTRDMIKKGKINYITITKKPQDSRDTINPLPFELDLVYL